MVPEVGLRSSPSALTFLMLTLLLLILLPLPAPVPASTTATTTTVAKTAQATCGPFAHSSSMFPAYLQNSFLKQQLDKAHLDAAVACYILAVAYLCKRTMSTCRLTAARIQALCPSLPAISAWQQPPGARERSRHDPGRQPFAKLCTRHCLPRSAIASSSKQTMSIRPLENAAHKAVRPLLSTTSLLAPACSSIWRMPALRVMLASRLCTPPRVVCDVLVGACLQQQADSERCPKTVRPLLRSASFLATA